MTLPFPPATPDDTGPDYMLAASIGGRFDYRPPRVLAVDYAVVPTVLQAVPVDARIAVDVVTRRCPACRVLPQLVDHKTCVGYEHQHRCAWRVQQLAGTLPSLLGPLPPDEQATHD